MLNVILFSSNNCTYCKQAKDFLAEKGIEFTEKNISVDMNARKELMSKGFMSVPVIVIGEEEVLGFDKAKLEKLLKLS